MYWQYTTACAVPVVAMSTSNVSRAESVIAIFISSLPARLANWIKLNAQGAARLPRELIDQYNTGNMDAERLFEALMAFVKALDEAEPKLTKAQEVEVNRIAPANCSKSSSARNSFSTGASLRGSTTERVLHEAPCPLLAIPAA
jgi:hypothetical protein